VVFGQEYDIHGVSIWPYVEGDEDTCMVRSLHFTRAGNINGLEGFNSVDSTYKYMTYRPRNGQELFLPVYTTRAQQVIVGMGQDRSSGFGTAKIFGVRDIRLHAKTTTTIRTESTIPGETSFTPGKITTETVTFDQTGTVTVGSGGQKTVNISAPYEPSVTPADSNIEYIHYNDIAYTGFSSSNSNVNVEIENSGSRATMVFTTDYSETHTETNVTYGPRLPPRSTDPDFTYYSKTVSGYVSSAPESGWISKNEGIKLFCDSSGNPVGFPTIPTQANTETDTGIITLASRGTDPSVRYGFYDSSEKSFITSGTGGEQVLPYSEYVERGPSRVFIAAVTTYEIDRKEDLPVSDDAPSIPRLWAMPVYGICFKSGSRIGIDPLPKNLGLMDLWSIPIRTGSFDRPVYIRPRSDESLTHWTQAYQDSTLRAYYSVPEATNGAWSLLYGRPNVDIKDEIPDIISQTVIRIRQAPILMVREPTSNPSFADPLNPVFKVSVRTSVNDPWTVLGREQIQDFNASNGTIYLKSPLESTDANLIKVSYTSSRKVYDFRQYEGNRINLNPYVLNDETLIGKAIYVYIVPEYVYDESNSLITQSVATTTVKWTTDPGIFSSLDSAKYNPLAIKLGVVYISNMADIEELIMLDTRTRGGGISESFSDSKVKEDLDYPRSFWDVSYGSGEAYQSGGFVIIRLPSELKARFYDDDTIIEEVVTRNVPAGVAYKIEDLNGNPWR
jgi:hypothetical protein